MRVSRKTALSAACAAALVGLAVTPAAADSDNPFSSCADATPYGVCFYEQDGYTGTPEYPTEFGLGHCHATEQVNHSGVILATDKTDGVSAGGELYLYENADCTGQGYGLGTLGAGGVSWGFKSYCITRTYPFLDCTVP